MLFLRIWVVFKRGNRDFFPKNLKINSKIIISKGKNEDIFMNLSQKESEILKPLSQTNSLILSEKLSPEIKVLKKTPGKAKSYQNHSNEKNSRHEKGKFLRKIS